MAELLDYGRDKTPISRIARISGWIALILAAAIYPLGLSEHTTERVFFSDVLLALICSIFGIIASLGRSVPAWGAMIIIFGNFMAGAINFT